MTNSKDYLRQVGISEEQFSFLLKRLEQEIEKDLQNTLLLCNYNTYHNLLLKD